MSTRVKRREEPNSVVKNIGRGVGVVFAVIKAIMVVSSLICMPVMFAWMLYLTFTVAPILEVLKVAVVLVVCLMLNLLIDPR